MKFGKLVIISFVLSIISFLLHNVIYGLFGVEEPVFFILTFLFVFVFITFGSYSAFMYILSKFR